MAFAPAPPDAVARISDVALHALAFAVLSFGVQVAYFSSKPLAAALTMLGYGVLIELVQMLLPARTAELKDLVVDVIGIGIGMGLFALFGRWLALKIAALLG